MKVYIVGSGKLARAILQANIKIESCEIAEWDPEQVTSEETAILVHAGSGRQLQECSEFCTRTKSVLIELSTGLETETMQPDFPLIVCANTSILVLKTMQMLKISGKALGQYEVSITESHQATKTTEPGTAFSFADSLRYPTDKIESIRDPEIQKNIIGIPETYVGKHAYHKIVIKDGHDQISIETKVLGHNSYAKGTKAIIEAVLKLNLECKRYSALDLIDMGAL